MWKTSFYDRCVLFGDPFPPNRSKEKYVVVSLLLRSYETIIKKISFERLLKTADFLIPEMHDIRDVFHGNAYYSKLSLKIIIIITGFRMFRERFNSEIVRIFRVTRITRKVNIIKPPCIHTRKEFLNGYRKCNSKKYSFLGIRHHTRHEILRSRKNSSFLKNDGY